MKTKMLPGFSVVQKRLSAVRMRDIFSGEGFPGQALYFSLGLLCAVARISGGLTPFGISFALSAPKGQRIAAFSGAASGYLLSVAVGAKYLAALLFSLAASVFFPLPKNIRENELFLPVTAFVTVALACGALSFAGGFELSTVATVISEALISAGTCYFFIRGKAALSSGIRVSPLRDNVCLSISAAVFITGLSPVKIFSLSLGRIIAAFFILYAAFVFREAGGAIAGVCASAAMLFGTGNPLFLSAAYGIGGLIAGIFSVFGKFGTVLSFTALNSIVTALMNNSSRPALPVFEIIAASVIFLILPIRAGASEENSSGGNELKDITVSKLSLAADALKDIAQATASASEKLAKISNNGDISRVYSAACEKVCEKCTRNAVCWQHEYSSTVDALQKTVKNMQTDGICVLPERFALYCKHPNDLVRELNREFLDFSAKSGFSSGASILNFSVSEQFFALSEMLGALSDDVENISEILPGLSGSVSEFFEQRLLFPREVLCYTASSGKLSVQVKLPENKLRFITEDTELLPELSCLCGRSLSAPSVSGSDGCRTVTFTEKSAFSANYAVSCRNKSGENFCGDSHSCVYDTAGNLHIFLSDGMGSGKEAALSSNITAGLLSRLAGAGLGIPPSLKMVNSALIARSGDESMATIDALSLDLFEGTGTVFKAGAAPTYLVRGGKISKFEAFSMPAGILGGISFEKKEFLLQKGDLIIMLSDGAVANGDSWLRSENLLCDGDALPGFANRLCASACANLSSLQDDDVTVIAALIS